MAEVLKTVLVEYTPAQMFALVDEVERYPEFLPWCGGTELHERSEAVTVATIRIAYGGIHQDFTTENRKQIPLRMDLSLRRGPFRHLEGHWLFKPLGDAACKVELRLDYEFANKLFEKLLAPVFKHIANTLVEEFIRRAEQVYGAR
jgi:ribosome-associated toxin RatA of RatAB toxin-antitoxin module